MGSRLERAEDEIRDLKQTLASLQALPNIHEGLQQQVREHRQYLENLLDRTIRVIYVIGAVLIIGVGIFGFKTLWDIDERLKKFLDEQVDKAVSKEQIANAMETRIVRYSRGATLAYIAAKSRESRPPVLKETELDMVADALRHPQEAGFHEALVIIGSYKEAKSQSDRFGKLLLNVVAEGLKQLPSRQAETQIISAVATVATLEYKGAGKNLLAILGSADIPAALQVAVLEALPRITTPEATSATVQTILQLLPKLGDRRTDVYRNTLIAAHGLQGDSIVKELEALASDDSSDGRLVLAQLIVDIAGRREGGYFPPAAQAPVATALVSLLASDKIELREDRLAGALFRFKDPRALSPDLRQMLERRPKMEMHVHSESFDKRSSGSTSLSVSSEFLSGDLFRAASAKALAAVPADKRAAFLQRIVEPVTQMHERDFRSRIKAGVLGPHADPGEWRDGLSITIRGSEGKPLSYEYVRLNKERTAVIAVPLTGGQAREIPLQQILWDKSQWIDRGHSPLPSS